MMFNFGSKRRQATTVAAALGVLAFGGVLASAATLGGVSGNTLGAGVATVASCDTNGVTVTYNNTFDDTTGTYKVTGVTIGGIEVVNPTNCIGKLLDVTLKDSSGAGIGSGGQVVAGPFETVAITGNTSAQNVMGVAVVIADN